MKKSVLHLFLSYGRFRLIADGDRLIEYRKVCKYYERRIWDRRHEIEMAIFHMGYSKVTIKREVIRIDVGQCPAGDFYRIHIKPKKRKTKTGAAMPR